MKIKRVSIHKSGLLLATAIIWIWSVYRYTLAICGFGLQNPFLTKTYQWLLYAVLSIACFGVFIFLSKDMPRKLLMLVGGTVCGATLALQVMSPIGLSSDYYRYLWQGRVSNSGQNNYALVPWDAGVEKANSELFERMDWRDVRSVYPPLAEQYFRLPAAIFDSTLFKDMSFRSRLSLSRIPNLMLYVLCGYLIYRVSKRRLYGFIWLALPLFQFEMVNSAHVDVLSIVLVLGALLSIRSKSLLSHAFAGAFIASAGMVKLTPFILIVPVSAYIFVHYSFKRTLALLAAFATVTALFVGPFITGHFALVKRMGYWLSGKEFSFGNPLYELSKRAAGSFGINLLRILTLVCLVFALNSLVKLIRERRMSYSHLLRYCLAFMLIPLISAPIVLPWYWVMPLAVMFLLSPKPSKRNFIVLLCLCILLTLQYVDRADDTLPVIRTYVIISSNLIFYLAIAMFYRAEVLRRSGRAKA